MSDNLRSIFFAVVTALVCSLLLTAAYSGLRPFQQENIEVDRKKNILKAVGLLEEGHAYSHDGIKAMYAENIVCMRVDAEGRVMEKGAGGGKGLPIYLYRRDGEVVAYVVPINTRGLWGKIHGYLALESDGSTVSGFTVYQHNETPGLGGEIEKEWFQKNFKGKKIVDQQGRFVSIGIAKPAAIAAMDAAEKINYVDGISGATLTGRFLTAGLKKILSEYEPVSIRFRSKEMLRVPKGSAACGESQ
ncbi:MAG: FMN-binding protein [Deltaproteobacteria bacterium]|nr:FMN-binding protein [Deltaproteobacteria bacterium]